MTDPIDPRIQGAIRLMTAAPKLLAACKKLIAWLEDDSDGRWDIDAVTIVEEAKAAIAEAEGTS